MSELKNPYLIQRCKSGEFKPEMISSEYIRFDYMGSAEFEWGALPQFQRDLCAKIGKLKVQGFEHDGKELFVLAEESQLSEYIELVKKVIERKIYTKESLRFDFRETRYCRNAKTGKVTRTIYDDPTMPPSFDLWWDLTNTLAFSRSEQVLNNLKVTVQNSVKKMNSR